MQYPNPAPLPHPSQGLSGDPTIVLFERAARPCFRTHPFKTCVSTEGAVHCTSPGAAALHIIRSRRHLVEAYRLAKKHLGGSVSQPSHATLCQKLRSGCPKGKWLCRVVASHLACLQLRRGDEALEARQGRSGTV
eukprot:1154350-Pelagomonas_calceolata.AAC.10